MPQQQKQRERGRGREEAEVTNETITTTATTENYIHFRLPASRSRSVADTLPNSQTSGIYK